MPAQPTVIFILFALQSLLSVVCALLVYSLHPLQSTLSAVFTLCSLQSFLSAVRSLLLHSLCSTVFTLCSLPPSLLTSLFTLCSLQTLHPRLPSFTSSLFTLSALHVCLPCSDLQVLGHVARCTLCIGCGSSSLSASSSRFTFVASKLGPAQLLNSLSCSTADSCCPPGCTPTLPCAAGRHFDPIHLAHLSKKEKKKHLFCSSSSSSLSSSPSPCLLYFR